MSSTCVSPVSPDTETSATDPLPDIAASAATHASALDWVGMEDITLPLYLTGQPVVARASAGVSLDDAGARGIHMSRLYRALRQLESRELDVARLCDVLEAFLASHGGLSSVAEVRLAGELPLERPALVSAAAGWKRYPFRIAARSESGAVSLELEVQVGYSSTCPCSAALARQAIQEQFDRDFTRSAVDAATVREWLGRAEGIVATPHSQRSEATVTVGLDPLISTLPLPDLIDGVEQTLGTALQTAVKRVDEKAFALANGRNLMFCEDAVRRLDSTLRPEYSARGYRIHVRHRESLHAHDAVARVERRVTDHR
ncbi:MULTISPECIES: GTP cyclohydrolase FolE2 [unclassified Thioalkalivibrio]|uniref:GTP cyclohydrolase FolE2 n=1 Tax=unclassified Thioalkalivibrio TaxID=2621013 RepID=UPI0003A6182D|nr:MULTISPECIES: GTP cyclohydrolase FolE2 [unclassified Thioalkalivibrio]